MTEAIHTTTRAKASGTRTITAFDSDYDTTPEAQRGAGRRSLTPMLPAGATAVADRDVALIPALVRESPPAASSTRIAE